MPEPYRRRAGVRPAVKYPNREIDRVMDAYNLGCRTTGEVSLQTGVSAKKCSVYSHALAEQGQLKRIGYQPRMTGERGRRQLMYEPGSAGA